MKNAARVPRLAVLALLALVLLARPAAASDATAPPPSWSPLRIAVECQSGARVPACELITAMVSNTPVLALAPRADAQVILFLNLTVRGNDDLVQLRFTSRLPGAPAAYELNGVVVDSRAGVDAQRAQLLAAFQRGAAVYLAQTVPDAVHVELIAPTAAVQVVRDTTPWGVSLNLSGNGSWSENYRSLGGNATFAVHRTEKHQRASLAIGAGFARNDLPPLEVGGESISLDTESYDLSGRVLLERHLDDWWAAGVLARAGHQDREGPFDRTVRAHGGLSRSWFRPEDPRGNRLEVAYLAGVQGDVYNRMNVLGEERAVFLTHGFLAGGTVRKDHTEYSVDIGALGELTHPRRRHLLSVSSSITLTLGDHVDLSLFGSVTRQAIPGPLDPGTTVEEVQRAGYAEPVNVFGFVNLFVHWDATNGAQNDRFAVASALGPLDNL